MKNLIILIAMFISVNTSFAAENKLAVVAVASLPCSVYVASNHVVVENSNVATAVVTITGKYGRELSKTNVNGKKQIPIKDLQQGKYTIKIKTADKEQTIRLDVL